MVEFIGSRRKQGLGGHVRGKVSVFLATSIHESLRSLMNQKAVSVGNRRRNPEDNDQTGVIDQPICLQQL